MLKQLAAAAIAFCVLSGTSVYGEQVLKIGYLLPEDSQLGAGATAFAAEVARRTNGKYRIEQYPSSALGGEVEMIKGVQASQIDIAFITNPPFSALIPELGIFDVPFLVKDAAHARALLDGPIGQEYLNKIADQGVVALAWGENGMRHMTNSKHAVKEPKDMEGLKLRVPQSPNMVKAFQSLGMQVEPLPFPALYRALETGKFDAQENPIATIVSAKFDKVQKHLSMTGHTYSWAVFIISKEAYDDLTTEEKAAFAQAARIGGVASRNYAEEAEGKGVESLRAAGMEVVTGIDREAFVAALKPVHAKFAEEFGAERIQRIRDAQ
ncbi:MAG: DctP family TRAP transporter solute-binding subunit [Rhodomicrobium sp.]